MLVNTVKSCDLKQACRKAMYPLDVRIGTDKKDFLHTSTLPLCSKVFHSACPCPGLYLWVCRYIFFTRLYHMPGCD